VQAITLAIGPTHRDYLLFVPATGQFAAPRVPLVVFLHGKGATAAWADDETGWSRLAAREGFALALPQALPPHPKQPPKFLTNPPYWQDATGTEDLAFLSSAIDDAATRAGSDPRRVFVSGFSNGAAMAFRVAAELSERVAAVAPVAGLCALADPRPARPIPTLHVVGSADPLTPLRGGDVRNPWQHRYVRRPPVVETLEKWARAIGCETTPRTDSDAGGVRVDTYPGSVAFRSVVIDRLGHHWPGGKGGFNHRIAGTPIDTVNGTELVWQFFREHL
jgi:polyhydroxybutyrate depolymerase